MKAQIQNPGVQAGASRNQLTGWLQSPFTTSESQVQMLACCFCLSLSMAQDIARLCFGEARND